MDIWLAPCPPTVGISTLLSTQQVGDVIELSFFELAPANNAPGTVQGNHAVLLPAHRHRCNILPIYILQCLER